MSLVDTQNQPDFRKIPIDKVGVKALKFPLTIQDRDSRQQHTVATVSMAVDLPHHFKGTHMSRFVEVLNAYGCPLTVANMAEMPLKLAEKLQAKEAHVEMSFTYFIEKKAPVTSARGMMDYLVTFEVNQKGGEVDFVVKVKVPVTTLCPCSKAISEYGAHNQRGEVTFSVRFQEVIWIEEMIEMVEKSASAQLYSVLKRGDEKFVTEQAYENPVFVEDLVRNVALQALGDQRIKWFEVEAENYESIHNHNAWARVSSETVKSIKLDEKN
jgi:GTP cyclohydrolase I